MLSSTSAPNPGPQHSTAVASALFPSEDQHLAGTPNSRFAAIQLEALQTLHSSFPNGQSQSQLTPNASSLERLLPHLMSTQELQWDPLGVVIAPTPVFSPGMLANAYYFGHPRWGREYDDRAHRSPAFGDRWRAALSQHQTPDNLRFTDTALGSDTHRQTNTNGQGNPESQSQAQAQPTTGNAGLGWDGKVIVDLGCGAGTLWKRLGGEPAEIIGVDISLGALRWAAAAGYAALRADAHHLPLKSGCADIVVANALLHHCDYPSQVLAEAARLVKPGGLLITDLDPQRSAWQRKGWGLWLQQQHWPRLMDWLRDDPLADPDQLIWAQATELHNRQPGQGLDPSLFHQALAPLGFKVQVYPHNSALDLPIDFRSHRGVGAELFEGQWGRSPWKKRWEQRLSSLDTNQVSSASSLLCLAQRQAAQGVE